MGKIEIIYLDNIIPKSEQKRLLADWKKFATENREAYIFNPVFYHLMQRQRNAIGISRRDLLVWN